MRCQINLSDEMVERVDFYAKKMGVSRSSLCSMLVGQGIMGFDKSMDVVSLIGDKLSDEFIDSLLTNSKKDK